MLFHGQVSFDLLEEYLEKHSEAASFGKKTSSFRENALFQDYHGLQSFRKVHPILVSKYTRKIYMLFKPSNTNVLFL